MLARVECYDRFGDASLTVFVGNSEPPFCLSDAQMFRGHVDGRVFNDAAREGSVAAKGASKNSSRHVIRRRKPVMRSFGCELSIDGLPLPLIPKLLVSYNGVG